MTHLHVMDPRRGDKHIQVENDKDLKKAERLFKKKLKEGFMAFGYKAGSRVAHAIRKFDKSFDRIVMGPAFMGG